MKKESLITAMKNSISNVLETMFFLPLVFSDDVHKKDCWSGKTDQIMAARLDFDGPFSGYCVFYIPKKFALSMTADFMGRDAEGLSDAQINGTIMEITNMIAGNTFSFYDEQAVFNLNFPKLLRTDAFQEFFTDSDNEIFIAIDSLENRLAFQLAINP
ncbi:MAG: chemotaxis protein CheX [Candidatus Desulfatibia sp.]|uniref:chemotaxis protein CheX n=1 Tax=Candidatus Desulfatibia sp. TaxID=3101189 RepID=UPI002F33CDD6